MTVFADVLNRHDTLLAGAQEIGRQLMRGDRAAFKLGYSHENAAALLTDDNADRILGAFLAHDDSAALRAHLLGYGAGLHRIDRDIAAALSEHAHTSDVADAFDAGYIAGLMDAPGAFPADLETAAARSRRERRETFVMRECGCGATRVSECTAAVEGYFTSLGQRSDEELDVLADGDECQAARVVRARRAHGDSDGELP
jgi:hypothetical protein